MRTRQGSFCRRGLAATLLATLCGCAATAVPPISETPTALVEPGRLVWIDLLTHDVERARTFYEGVFGWDVQTTPDPGYRQILSHGRPVGGIFDHQPRDPKVSETQWLMSMSVEDVDAAAATTRAAGGRVLVGPANLPGRGRHVVVSDPSGATLVLLRASGGDPREVEVRDGEWWFGELWTRDIDAAARFYRDLAALEAKVLRDDDGDEYVVLGSQGKARAGVALLRWPDVLPNWLPYIRVGDVSLTLERIEAAGGATLLAPAPDFYRGRVAIVSDPTGGVFAIQQAGS